MATVNRLKNKHKQSTNTQSTDYNNGYQDSNTVPSPIQNQKVEKRAKIFGGKHTEDKEKEYQAYYEHKQANPIGFQFNMQCFPHNTDLYAELNLPLGFTFSPLIALENEQATVMEKNIQSIPRCGSCRAYMNCYNRIEKNKFFCFLCGNANYTGEYNDGNLPNDQRNSSIFQARGYSNFYLNLPAEECIVFLIDISPDAAHSHMLQFAIAAIKQVLSRAQFDQTIIYLYTYDEIIYEYDFSGAQIKCVVVDKSIANQFNTRIEQPTLRDFRDKLFQLLDQLQEMSQYNIRKGSNFTYAFNYVYQATKAMGAHYIILQSNQAFSGQPTFMQQPSKAGFPQYKQNPIPPKSIFDTRNKTFFDKYAQSFFDNSNTISLFIFGKGYKNIMIFSDLCKISSSELKYYSKDSTSDLNKFYYELTHSLGATYFKQIKVEFLISHGWRFTTVFGNSHRAKDNFICFLLNHCELTRKYFIVVAPNKSAVQNPPHCTIQLVINYRYKKQHFVTVLTAIQTVSGYNNKIYDGLDAQMSIGVLAKNFLANLRSETILFARRQLIQSASKIYLSALGYFKNNESIPTSVMTILGGTLALLKSIHGQPQIVKNSPAFDKIIAQRNYLTFCNIQQIATYFSPYLFSLSEMDQSMCREDIQFAYPPTVQIKFHEVKQGLFLMDAGLQLYLFIAKQCEINLLTNVLGKSKFQKNQIITEETLNQQETFEAQQVRTLIQYLRAQKSYSWIPLHVVRCGEGTIIEKNFYLYFTLEKYDQFKMWKLSFTEYLEYLKRPQGM